MIRGIKKSDIDRVKVITTEGAPFLGLYPEYVYWILTELYPEYQTIAEVDGVVAGFATALPVEEKKSLFLWQLGVGADYRRQGLGYEMVHAAFEYARDKGFTGLITSISDKNPGSLNTFGKIAREYGLVMEPIGKYDAPVGPVEDVYWIHEV